MVVLHLTGDVWRPPQAMKVVCRCPRRKHNKSRKKVWVGLGVKGEERLWSQAYYKGSLKENAKADSILRALSLQGEVSCPLR